MNGMKEEIEKLFDDTEISIEEVQEDTSFKVNGEWYRLDEFLDAMENLKESIIEIIEKNDKRNY